METVVQLAQRRAALVAQARAILDAAKKENRDISAEDTSQVEALFAESDKIKAQIDARQKSDALQARADELAHEMSHVDPQEIPGRASDQRADAATLERRREIRRFCRGGRTDATMHFSVQVQDEERALQADNFTTGGALVTPEQFVAQLIKNVDNLAVMRQFATVIPVPKAVSLGVPTLDTDVGDLTWTSEILTGSEDSSMALGKRALYPHPLARLIKVSNTLLRQATIDPEALVRARLAYKLAVVEENCFLNGTGSNQPLGLFTASANGVTTSQDVTTTKSADIAADDLISMLYKIKDPYARNAKWIFHRDSLAKIRKLKGGDGHYLWAVGLAGAPDTILNRPVISSEYAPNTFSTTCYVGIFGDLSHYWIADALDMQIVRLSELYAATNQTGFIIRAECDGMPTVSEAFARMKLL